MSIFVPPLSAIIEAVTRAVEACGWKGPAAILGELVVWAGLARLRKKARKARKPEEAE